MGLPSSVLTQVKSKSYNIVSNIVITINDYTDRNTILFITIHIQRLSNSQTQRFYLANLSDFVSEMAL